MGDVAGLLYATAPRLRDKTTRGHNYVLIQCPYHGGGTENTPSCSVSLEKPVFFCHSCQESGHLTRLLQTLGLGRTLAKEAVERLGLRSKQKRTRCVQVFATDEHHAFALDPYRGQYLLDNDLLDVYRQAPRALLDAGFRMQTLRHFEVGFDKDNFRITFPLRNIYGDLVGISGRAIMPDQEPRYRIYRRELIERTDFAIPEEYTLDSVKEALLWHGHIARPFLYRVDDEPVIVTEGFKACMAVYQAGFPTAVALVGAYLSNLQAELMVQSTALQLLFLDNNPAGKLGTYYAAERLQEKGGRVKIANYPDEREQPDALTPDEVAQALRTSLTFTEWRTRNADVVHEVAWKRNLRERLRTHRRQ